MSHLDSIFYFVNDSGFNLGYQFWVANNTQVLSNIMYG